MNTVIYFIYDSQRNAVKIGITNDVERRLYGLQTGNPVKLELKYSIVGTHRDEKLLHKHYEKYNILREWFEYSDEIMFDIEQNNFGNIIDSYKSHKQEIVKKPLVKRVKIPPESKPSKEKKTPVIKIKKQIVRKTQEELKENKKKCTKKYKQRKVIEKVAQMYNELEKHFVRKKDSFIPTKELSDYLFSNNIKSKYGEKNIPVKHVAEHFDVQIKKMMIDKKRQHYIIGLDYANREVQPKVGRI